MRNYRQFVAEVDPKGGIMDHLIEAGVVSIETKERLVSNVTRQDRCRATLDELLGSSHQQAFVVLQRALREHYPWIADRMNQVNSDDSSDQVDSAFAAPNVREMARRLDEVERNLRQSPTPNVERDLRRQIDDLRVSESQLMQQVDSLTTKNRELREELDRIRQQRQTSSELSDLKDEMETQRANEIELKVQLAESVERERLLEARLEQAAVREKLLRQEVRQAVQDERTQLISRDAEVMLTSALASQTDDCVDQVDSGSTTGELLETLCGSSAAVYGVTVLDHELYVARDRSSVIEVFDLGAPLTPSSCLRRLTVTSQVLPQPVRPLDIAACAETRSLYVSDAANARLHRADARSGRVVCSWRVDSRAWALSVTAGGTVLVCCRGAGLLCEYTPSGQLVRQVRLPDDVAQPVHAVEVGRQYVVSHYDVESNLAGARVCVVDAAGAVRLDHDELSQPHHLAAVCDDDGARPLVAVADCGNDRVKLLDAATLGVVAVVGGSRRPHRLCVQRGRLYVGQWDGRVLVFQLPPALSSPVTL